jgi:heme/copper-type cytochrome/quinol oxidase subunit 4
MEKLKGGSMKKIFLGFLIIVALGVISFGVVNKGVFQANSGSNGISTDARFQGHVFLD